MKTPYLVLGLLGLLALSTCKTPQQQTDRQTATEIDICPVERRDGWRWKYKVIAAAFTAESFKGGWVGSYDFSFFFASAAKEKISFVQFDSQRNQAMVVAVNSFKTVEVPAVRNCFGVPIQYEQIFPGAVHLPVRKRAFAYRLN